MIPVFVKKNRVSLIIMVVLTLGFLGAIVFWAKEAKKSSAVRQEYDSVRSELERIISRRGGAPSQELIDYLNEKKRAMAQRNAALWATARTPETRMPEEVSDPLGFKDALVKTQERIRITAMEAGISLPLSLGFSSYETVIPPQEKIPYLVKQLSFLEDFVNLLIQVGITQIESIQFSLPRDVEVQGLNGEAFYREFPLGVTLILPSSRVGLLFYQLRSSPYILLVDKAGIISQRAGEQPGRLPGARGSRWAGRGSLYSSQEKLVSVTLLMSMVVFLE